MGCILLDSANLDEISEFCRSYAVMGVTTNPVLIAKSTEGSDQNYIDRIGSIIKKMEIARENLPKSKLHLSVEVLSLNPDEMLNEAWEIKDKYIDEDSTVQVFIKIPVTFENLRVISQLSKANIPVNATACMSYLQAKMADDAGAQVVSFFYNRMFDHLYQWDSVNHEISKYVSDAKKFLMADTICGSIRNVLDIESCFSLGVDFVTVSGTIIRKMLQHPQTDRVLREFEEAAKQCR